jgi:hypothetical protein
MLHSKWIALGLVCLLGATASAQVAREPNEGVMNQDRQQSVDQGPRTSTQARDPERAAINEAFTRLIRTQVARLTGLANEVNLTQDQTQRLQQALAEHKHEIAKQAESIWQHRVALRDAVLAEQPNEEQIRKEANDLGKAMGDAAVFASRMKQHVAPIFTQEQRTSFRRYLDNSERDMQQFFSQLGGATAPTRTATPEGPTTR